MLRGPSVLTIKHSGQKPKVESQVHSCLDTYIPAGPCPLLGSPLHGGPVQAEPQPEMLRGQGEGLPGTEKPLMLPKGPTAWSVVTALASVQTFVIS